MSWFSNLVETYDRLSDIVGIPDTDGNVLLPLNHMAGYTDVCVVIDSNGGFRRAEEGKENIIIPCTAESATQRTGAIVPHALHEQLGYLVMDAKKNKAYMSQLARWKERHPKVEAVYKYLLKNTIIDDLHISGIERFNDPKLFIRFSVEVHNDCVAYLWEDASVAKSWQDYCRESEQSEQSERSLCYVSGECGVIPVKHPKGINNIAYGAKLISIPRGDPDWIFTYRGRFTDPKQANAISASTSHKAHAMLKYLIETQSYRCDKQAIVAWAIDNGSALPSPFDNSLELYSNVIQTDSDKLIDAQGALAVDYAEKLKDALNGKGNASRLVNQNRRVAVIAVDAATEGRMSVTFYQDMMENEYIDRICDWHESCKWFGWQNGKEYISTPNSDRIIAAVFGKPKKKDDKNYNKIKKQARERLLHCIVCGERIERAWMVAALNRINNPFSYSKQTGGWDKYGWLTAIGVVCATARKYYIDKKEVFSLELETGRTGRDYLYGRLLAFADKIESDARFQQIGKDDTDKRPTNAVRYTQRFSVKPFSTWGLLYSQLNPYIQRLKDAGWYQKQIDEIMSLFEAGQFEEDRALSAEYLMGYSLQRRAFYKNKNKDNVKDEEGTKNESEQKN